MDWSGIWAQLATQFNFENLANGLLVAIVGLLGALGVRRGKQQVATEKPQVKETTIYTTDTVAWETLARSMEGLTFAVTENNMLLKADKAERDRDKEVQRRLKEEQLQDRIEDLERSKSRSPR